MIKGVSDASKPKYFFTEEQFKDFLRLHKGANLYIYQKFISGVSVGYFTFSINGEPIIEFIHRRVVEKKPSGGPSVVACAYNDPEAIRIGRRIIRHLSWTGIIMVEMRKEYLFLKKSSVWGLQQIARKFDFALKMFVKYKDEGYEFPTYKRKKNYDGILIYPRDFKIEGSKLYLPKIGWVRIRDKILKRIVWGKMVQDAKQVWVKEEPDGFFAYIVYEGEGKRKRRMIRLWA